MQRSRDFRLPGRLLRLLRHLAVLLAAFLIASAAQADGFPAPAGPVLLTVTGKLGRTNQGAAAAFDEALFAGLPQKRVETSTPWTDGTKVFEGVLLADLLDFLDVKATGRFRAVALNEYEIDTPLPEAVEHGALLATRMDGKPMTRRDKGPIWIVYPRDANPRIQDERHDARWVWQLARIEIE